jgi:hypothetical protein
MSLPAVSPPCRTGGRVGDELPSGLARCFRARLPKASHSVKTEFSHRAQNRTNLRQVKIPIVLFVLNHEIVASRQLQYSSLHFHQSQHYVESYNLCLLLSHSGGHERGIVRQNFLHQEIKQESSQQLQLNTERRSKAITCLLKPKSSLYHLNSLGSVTS